MSETPELIRDGDPCLCGALFCMDHVRPRLVGQLLAFAERKPNEIHASNELFAQALRTIQMLMKGPGNG